jgi:hypothetical protein
MWLFGLPEHNAQVAGFNSLSESTQAQAYLRATAFNLEKRSKKSWGSEAVVGRGCTLDLAIVEGSKGHMKRPPKGEDGQGPSTQ